MRESWAYLEGGGRGRPPIEEIFAPFKYSLNSFLPNHGYSLCRQRDNYDIYA